MGESVGNPSVLALLFLVIGINTRPPLLALALALELALSLALTLLEGLGVIEGLLGDLLGEVNITALDDGELGDLGIFLVLGGAEGGVGGGGLRGPGDLWGVSRLSSLVGWSRSNMLSNLVGRRMLQVAVLKRRCQDGLEGRGRQEGGEEVLHGCRWDWVRGEERSLKRRLEDEVPLPEENLFVGEARGTSMLYSRRPSLSILRSPRIDWAQHRLTSPSPHVNDTLL